MGESTRETQGFSQGWGKLTQTGNKWLEKLQFKELRWMNATDTVPLKSLEMPPCYMKWILNNSMHCNSSFFTLDCYFEPFSWLLTTLSNSQTFSSWVRHFLQCFHGLMSTHSASSSSSLLCQKTIIIIAIE